MDDDKLWYKISCVMCGGYFIDSCVMCTICWGDQLREDEGAVQRECPGLDLDLDENICTQEKELYHKNITCTQAKYVVPRESVFSWHCFHHLFHTWFSCHCLHIFFLFPKICFLKKQNRGYKYLLSRTRETKSVVLDGTVFARCARGRFRSYDLSQVVFRW